MRRHGAPASVSLRPTAQTLAGDWTVRRTMVDFLTGARHGFEGHAVITADAFTEHGTMRIGSREMPASRRYRIEPGEGATRILHADGRDFIALGTAAAQAVRHQCGADLYAGRFFFRGPDDWAEIWRVNGPRKSYASLGWFRRISD